MIMCLAVCTPKIKLTSNMVVYKYVKIVDNILVSFYFPKYIWKKGVNTIGKDKLTKKNNKGLHFLTLKDEAMQRAVATGVNNVVVLTVILLKGTSCYFGHDGEIVTSKCVINNRLPISVYDKATKTWDARYTSHITNSKIMLVY